MDCFQLLCGFIKPKPIQKMLIQKMPIQMMLSRKKPTRGKALKNATLFKLPIELLQKIAKDLPVASAVSFSLSCRRLYFLIGNRYLEDILAASRKKVAFLNLLERDFTDHVSLPNS